MNTSLPLVSQLASQFVDEKKPKQLGSDFTSFLPSETEIKTAAQSRQAGNAFGQSTPNVLASSPVLKAPTHSSFQPGNTVPEPDVPAATAIDPVKTNDFNQLPGGIYNQGNRYSDEANLDTLSNAAPQAVPNDSVNVAAFNGNSEAIGKGGTVSTMPAANFMTDPRTSLALARKAQGVNADGTGFSQQHLNDQMLRKEGNAHLASDATQDEKLTARRRELKMALDGISLSTNQSFGDLAESKARKTDLRAQLASLGETESARITAQKDLATEDRKHQNALELEALKGSGLGGLKVGGTMERLRDKASKLGYAGLSPNEQSVYTEKLRSQISKDNPYATADEVNAKVSETINQYQPQKGLFHTLAPDIQAALKKNNVANAMVGGKQVTYEMDETGNVTIKNG